MGDSHPTSEGDCEDTLRGTGLVRGELGELLTSVMSTQA